MTSTDLDSKTTPEQLPPLRRGREFLTTWAADIAARSQAQILAGWLRVAAGEGKAQIEIDVALQHARECAVDFTDFAILADREPATFAAICQAELGRELEAACAMVRAEVVARGAQVAA